MAEIIDNLFLEELRGICLVHGPFKTLLCPKYEQWEAMGGKGKSPCLSSNPRNDKNFNQIAEQKKNMRG